jgi:hypothetical protein
LRFVGAAATAQARQSDSRARRQGAANFAIVTASSWSAHR